MKAKQRSRKTKTNTEKKISNKRQHKRTSSFNVFDHNHRIRKQKKNIERQRILNIKATTKSETKKLKQ